MRGRRRFVRRNGVRLPLRWTANLSNNNALAVSSQEGLIITEPADYQISDNLEPSGPVVVRIRGRLSFMPTMTLGVIGQLFACVVAVDSDIPTSSSTISPNSAANAIDERFLWWDHMLCTGYGATPAAGSEVTTREIDIKAKVRLKDTTVYFIIVTDATMAGFYGVHFRALLRG